MVWWRQVLSIAWPDIMFRCCIPILIVNFSSPFIIFLSILWFIDHNKFLQTVTKNKVGDVIQPVSCQNSQISDPLNPLPSPLSFAHVDSQSSDPDTKVIYSLPCNQFLFYPNKELFFHNNVPNMLPSANFLRHSVMVPLTQKYDMYVMFLFP